MRKILLSFLPLIIFLFAIKSSAAQTDIEVFTIDFPTSGCLLGPAENVGVRLKNVGSVDLLNLTVSVTYKKNGVIIATEPFFIASFLHNTYYTCNFSATVDLSVSGTYNFEAYTSKIAGDGIQTNDTIGNFPAHSLFVVTNYKSVGGTLTTMKGGAIDSLCVGFNYNHLTLSGYTTPFTNIKGWQYSSSGSGPWLNIGKADSTTYYNLPTLGNPTYYRAVVRNTVPAPPCDTIYSSIATLYVMPIPRLTDFTTGTGACSGHLFTYTASSAFPNPTFSWTKVATPWSGIAPDTGSFSGGWNPMSNTFTSADTSDHYAFYRYITTSQGCNNASTGGEIVSIWVNEMTPHQVFAITPAFGDPFDTVCMSTKRTYTELPIQHAAWYIWSDYTGTNVSADKGGQFKIRFDTLVFSPSVGNLLPLATSGSITVSGQNYCTQYAPTNGLAGPTSPKDSITVELAALVHAAGPDYMCTVKPVVLSGAQVGGSISQGTWSIQSLSPVPPGPPGPPTYGTLTRYTPTSLPDTVHYTPPSGYAGTVTLRLTTDVPISPAWNCGSHYQDRIIMVNAPSSASPGPTRTMCQSVLRDSLYLNLASIGGSSPPGTKAAWSIDSLSGKPLPPPGIPNPLIYGYLSSTADTIKLDSICYFPPSNYAGTVTLRLITTSPIDGVGPYFCIPDTVYRKIIVDSLAKAVSRRYDTVCQSAATVVPLRGAYVKGGATQGRWEKGGFLPAHGVLSAPVPFWKYNGALAAMTYTFAAGFVGWDTLRLITKDTTALLCHSDTAFRYIRVDSIAKAFTKKFDTVCQSATPQVVLLSGAHVFGGATRGQWKKVGGAHGTLSPASGFQPNNGIDTTKYTLVANFPGTDTLRLVSNDTSVGHCGVDSTDRYITVDSLAKSIAGGPDNFCQSPLPRIVTLSGSYIKGGSSKGQWETVGISHGTLSPASGYQPNNGIDTTKYTLNANFAGTDTLRLVSNDTTALLCHVDTSFRFITAAPTPIGGTVGNDAIVCKHANGDTLTLTEYKYITAIDHWQYSVNGGSSWINIVNTTTKQSYSNIDSTTWYRALVKGSCDSAYSVEARITVDAHPLSVGGTISKSAKVCNGRNLDTLKLTGNTGKIIRWEYSIDGGHNWVYVNDTMNRLIYHNLTDTTIYHAVSLNSACGSANSSNDTIFIDPMPIASAGGSITICSNDSVTVSGATASNGTILWSQNGTGLLSGQTTLTPKYIAGVGDIGNAVTLTLKVKSLNTNACFPDSAMATYTINVVNVNPIPTALAGKCDTICQTGTAAFIGTATNGTIIWTHNGLGGITAGQGTASPSYTAVAGDAGHTVVLTMTVTSNACLPSITATAFDTVKVNALPTATAGGSQTICSNGAFAAVSGATALNGTILWAHNGTGILTLPGTLTPIYTSAPTDAGNIVTLTMTVTSNNKCIPNTASATYTVNVSPLPTATAGGSATICSNGSATVSAASSSNGTIQWSANPGAAGVITSGANTLTPTYTAAAGDAGNTVTLTMTVTSVPACVPAITANATYTIIINPAPTASAGSPTQTICSNDTAKFIGAVATPPTATILWTHNGLGAITAGQGTTTPTYTAAAGDAGHTITLTMTVTNSSCLPAIKATAFDTVKVNAAPTATAGGSQTICQTGTAIISGASASNGTIVWTENGAGSITAGQGTISPTYTAAAGDAGHSVILTMTVKSINACAPDSATALYIVNVAPKAVAGTLSGTATVCSGSNGTLTLSGETGNIIEWQDSTNAGATWIDIPNTTGLQTYNNITTTTWYRVIVTSASCGNDTLKGNLQGKITVTPPSDSGKVSGTIGGRDTTNQTFCAGPNSGTIHLRGQTGNIVRWEFSTDGGFTWIYINNTDTIQTYNNPVATTYYRAVVQNGVCPPKYSNKDTITVRPHSAGLLSSVPPSCAPASDTLRLAGYVAGGTILWQYSINAGVNWRDTTGITSVQGYTNLTDTRWYRVIVTNGTCPADTSSPSKIIVYSKPNAVFTADANTICLGTSTIFTNASTIGSGFIQFYQWDFGDNTNSLAQHPPLHKYLAPGTYRDTLVTISDHGCLDTASANVVVNDLPHGSIAHNRPLKFCSGDSTTLSALPGGMNYSWLTGPTTQSVVAKAPGHWMVTITDPSTTCSAVVDSLVIIYPNPNAVFEADTVCLGMVTTFVNSSTISSGFIQLNQWDFGDNSSSLSINPTHTYSVAGDTTVHLYTKSNYGCWDTAIQRVLVHPNPIVLAGSDVTIMLGNNVILNGQGATTYLWSPNIGLNNPNIFNPVASPLFTTVYELTGADINGCRNKDTLTITVIGSMTTNLLTANGDGYNDKWLVTNIENYPGTEVIVVNREGQQVYYNSSYDNSWDGTNNGKALPDGTYYYFIKFNNGKIYKGPITILNEKK